MPTPAIAYLTQTYGATAGVVISASHNHFQDNGVKFFSNKGLKFSDQDQRTIEKRLSEPMVSVTSENIGKANRKPASSADSNKYPEIRVSLPITTLGFLFFCAKTEPTAQPNFKKKSAVIGFIPTLPRMPSVPK
jgi:hypothetical protein